MAENYILVWTRTVNEEPQPSKGFALPAKSFDSAMAQARDHVQNLSNAEGVNNFELHCPGGTIVEINASFEVLPIVPD